MMYLSYELITRISHFFIIFFKRIIFNVNLLTNYNIDETYILNLINCDFLKNKSSMLSFKLLIVCFFFLNRSIMLCFKFVWFDRSFHLFFSLYFYALLLMCLNNNKPWSITIIEMFKALYINLHRKKKLAYKNYSIILNLIIVLMIVCFIYYHWLPYIYKINTRTISTISWDSTERESTFIISLYKICINMWGGNEKKKA